MDANKCTCQFSDTDYVMLEKENKRLRDALVVIVGPEDRGPWMDDYREAGGGYAGLQAIARRALR